MSDALSEEFFAEVADKYYPQVLEGLEVLGAGEVGQGIEILARPLHTIKGVTGFMPGFEDASAITHKVESFLKKLQAGTLPHSSDNLSLAVYGVNSVFAVIEQIRDQGAPDKGELEAVAAVLEAASGGQAKSNQTCGANCVITRSEGGAAVVALTCRRLHRKAERDQVVGAILATPQETPVILDCAAVLTVGSAMWDDLAGLAGMWTISVRGLSAPGRETFMATGSDARMALVPAAPAGGDKPAAQAEESAQ